MKQGQNARKGGRPRNAPRKSNKGAGGNSRGENRVRGNPKQHLEKYKNLAREALQAGDRVTAEYNFQFADHYQRLVNEMNKNAPQNQRKPEASDAGSDANSDAAEAGDAVEGNADTEDNKRKTRPPRSNNRRTEGRGRRPKKDEPQEGVDLADAAQPKEVHPELDLPFLEKPVPIEGDEKPTPPKRGRPKKVKPAKEVTGSSDDEAAV